MPIYLVLGRDTAGKQRTAKIKADSPEHARARAAANGITAETIAVDTTDAAPAVAPAAPVVAEKPAARVQTYAPRLEQGHQAGAPVMNIATPRRGNSLGIASIILGVLAFLICWIPLVNIVSLPLSGLGLLLGVIGLIVAMTRGGSSIGLPIAGSAVSLLALVVAGVMWLAIVGGTRSIGRMAEAEAEAQRQRAAGVAATSTSPAKAPDVAPTVVSTPPTDPTPAAPQATTPTPSTEKATPAPAAPALADPYLVEPPMPFRNNDIDVRLARATIAPVTLVDDVSKKRSKTADALMAIEIEIRNLKANNKLTLRTLGRKAGAFDVRAKSRLKDNFGNVEVPVQFEMFSRPVGHEDSYTVFPGDSVTDVIVFERPVPNATTFDLIIDGDVLGLPKDLTIRIPASMIKR